MDKQGYKSIRHAQRFIDRQRAGLGGERVEGGQPRGKCISPYPQIPQHQFRISTPNSPHSLPNIMAFTAVSKGNSI